MKPFDRHNEHLIQQVHPPDWVNPTPQSEYDLVVIGGGTAGLVIAAGSAGLGIGLKIALIEKAYMGGDCLNFGCVPSKAMIRSARAVGELKDAVKLGVIAQAMKVDFAQVMERMRSVRSGISHHDSAQRFRELGVDVFFGEARFLNPHRLQVSTQSASGSPSADIQLTFKKAAIATGARAVEPEVPGLKAAGFLTNESVFELTECPKRLAVVGGGPIGCELAQTFQRLGSEVVLIHRSATLLNKEDPEAAAIVQNQLQRDGIQLELQARLVSVEGSDDGKFITIATQAGMQTITVDEILVGAGRQPNVASLNLEAIGVDYDRRKGVIVNDTLQTSRSHIYAAGDCCMDWKFTHAADFAARIVIKNAFFSPFGLGRSKLSDLVMPWVTYTSPEVAHVGRYEHEIEQPTTSIVIPMETVDRALTDGETEGFVKVVLRKGSDEILGATIVSSHAGEMISEITTAMVNKIGLGKLASVIHPYPTQADAIRKAADAYRRTLLSDRTRALLKILSRLS